MIKDNQKILNRLHIVLDVFVIILAYAISYKIKFHNETRYYFPFRIYAKTFICLIPIYVASFILCGLYRPKRSKTHFAELPPIILANIVGLFTYIFVLFFFKNEIKLLPENFFVNISRRFLIIYFITNTLLLFFYRMILVYILRFARRRGFNLKHVLVVGYSRAAEAYIDRIKDNPQWGYMIHGILDDTKGRKYQYKGVEVKGPIDALLDILPDNKMDEIVIALSLDEYSKLEHIVALCEKSGVHTLFIPDYNNVIPTQPYTEDLNGLPVVNIRRLPLNNILNKVLKRAMDIFGSLIALIIFSIPMLLVAVIIKLTSNGPLIFSQVRVGLHNRTFKMYKFRSMEVQPESQEKKAWTTLNDPRVTPIGKFIRRTSIDELPQLFNVLKGDMSLIGPRPERPFFVEKFKEEIPRYMVKHQVRPGLTGWAQVNGYRGDTSIRKRIDCDLYYIENWTLSLDIKILFMTILKGFVNKNAY